MIYYQPTYKDARYILATTDEAHTIWMVGDKPPTIKPTAMIGHIEWTYAILDAMGIARPPAINYQTFPSMQRHFKRAIGQIVAKDIERSTWGRLDSLFIKPATTLKTWTGELFTNYIDIIAVAGADTLCDVSQKVFFADEIRTFWRRVDGAWQMEAAVAYPQIEDEPDMRSRSCLGTIAPADDLPCSTLVLDIGTMTIKKNSTTTTQAIVEIGDMFAMGTYGADAAYLRCHRQWCTELLK